MGRHSLTGRAGAAAALTKFATEPGLMIVGCAKRTAGRVPGARHGCATGRGGDGPPPAKLVRECTGCGAVWQRACFGSKKSPVQIRPARLVFRTSVLLKVTNQVTTPSDVSLDLCGALL